MKLLKIFGMSKKSRARFRHIFTRTVPGAVKGVVERGVSLGDKMVANATKMMNTSSNILGNFENPLFLMGALVVGGIVAVKVL